MRKPFPEPAVLDVLRQNPSHVFVDVGANYGDYCRKLWRNYSRIIALEPNPEAFCILRSLYGWRSFFNHFEPYQCAASDMNGSTFLYLNPDKARCNGSADTIEPVFDYRPISHPEISQRWDYRGSTRVRRETVEARRLDSLLSTVKETIDMKIDVEGAELRVLRGTYGILDRVKRIIVELHDRENKGILESLLSAWFETRWIDQDHILGVKR